MSASLKPYTFITIRQQLNVMKLVRLDLYVILAIQRVDSLETPNTLAIFCIKILEFRLGCYLIIWQNLGVLRAGFLLLPGWSPVWLRFSICFIELLTLHVALQSLHVIFKLGISCSCNARIFSLWLDICRKKAVAHYKMLLYKICVLFLMGNPTKVN